MEKLFKVLENYCSLSPVCSTYEKVFTHTHTHSPTGLGFPTVLIPWVVLQELDSLKNGKRLSSSVAHLATPAVHYIYTSLKSQEPRLWGQSMQQASQSSRESLPQAPQTPWEVSLNSCRFTGIFSQSFIRSLMFT